MNELIVFMAFHHNFTLIPSSYIRPILCGSIDNKLVSQCVTTDSTGDNISRKNDKYSELTALYWIWKNSSNDYLGLCHYRRFFDIKYKSTIKSLNHQKIIVPRKLAFKTSVEEQYIKVHGASTWDIMLTVLKAENPDYYQSALSIFNNNQIYPYNMFIASKDFINKYCEWLFNLLMKIEQKVDEQKMDQYQKRYLGFLSERLFTVYILHTKSDLFECKVVNHEKKNIQQNFFENIIRSSVFKFREIF